VLLKGTPARSSAVPINNRVPETSGDYLSIDLSDGPFAASYPVSYYKTLADVPGGVNSDAYKTTRLLMRRIPKGTFTMGSPANEIGRSNNETQHKVTLTQDFFIGVFEVTQRQWERVMSYWPSFFNNVSCRDTRPVEQLSYNAIRGVSTGSNWPASGSVDATSFMGRLRARTGKAFDLPTEAQWEYACRAGTSTALNSGKNLASPSSDDSVAVVGRYYFNRGKEYTQEGSTSVGSAKVGSYKPNPWGLYDMHGNVWEWCLDWYKNYSGTVSDPTGAAEDEYRIGRGGGWNRDASQSRAAYRSLYTPDNFFNDIGLRVALPLDQ